MEDFQLDIVVGKGPAASSIRLTLPPFTLVGATTRTGMITGPLRDRFGLGRPARLLRRRRAGGDRRAGGRHPRRPIDARRGVGDRPPLAGTPRIANRLLRRVRDFAEVRGDGTIDAARPATGSRVFGVDDRGLDKVDRAILGALCQQFGGGPVGLSTLAISVGEQPETVEDVYEPFLIQQGLLARTPRGRGGDAAAYDHLGLTPPAARRAPRPVRLTLTSLREWPAGVPTRHSAGSDQAGRCSARKAIVFAHAGLGGGLVVEHLASWLSNAWPAASTLSTKPDRPAIAAASASTPRSGCRRRRPKWNSVGQDRRRGGRASPARPSRSS